MKKIIRKILQKKAANCTNGILNSLRQKASKDKEVST